MRASMSRRGNCYDNAPIESFWGSLKSELIYPSALRNARAGQARHRRVHRNILQPAAHAGTSELPVARCIYAAILSGSYRCLTCWPPPIPTDLRQDESRCGHRVLQRQIPEPVPDHQGGASAPRRRRYHHADLRGCEPRDHGQSFGDFVRQCRNRGLCPATGQRACSTADQCGGTRSDRDHHLRCHAARVQVAVRAAHCGGCAAEANCRA
ncbi:hypothetical protein C7399_1363 [Paraburkholderia tropica]|uniref:Transposase n=1 Tax=Paraburkholderia tropica TaxID=92647 RepID=A0ABX5MCZ9_9BURK|nr:hypothetical protein C7400_13657 [Paraburkholderia tropica]PZW71972.1 hypothetical protein C7399_1363 [Paraburkholderia tropica]